MLGIGIQQVNARARPILNERNGLFTVTVYDARTKDSRVPLNAFQRRQHTPPQIAVPIG
jgi:hypothetical protein